MSCPKYDKDKGIQVCPECEHELDDYNQGEDTLQYCGPGCSNCGWSHCGGCI